ncbi:peroxidase 72-like isoform X2 [Macadamia integrifolia]|uniref:peroxidase 72-like isoform X2 n=1 Tax=Macadamia integrifolia TaxID=60698 RepID=UPI001C4E5510|nr:peroxidase 72-like isoform X2 [Macadamia integrifolia]
MPQDVPQQSGSCPDSYTWHLAMTQHCQLRFCDFTTMTVSLDAPGYPPPEKMALSNRSLRGFNMVDMIKRVLEAVCPGTVSCADILALSARDAVVLAGGPSWKVPTGRRDGRLSSAVLARISIPRPQFSAVQLKKNFLWHGMSTAEMIVLSGAHTIGSAHCVSFWDRLYHHNFTNGTDPSMASYHAEQLKKICPISSYKSKQRVPLDPITPFKFDNMYYKNLNMGLGLLASDQVIHDKLTSVLSSNSTLWERSFCKAMVHLGNLNVKTGSRGEIRRNCRRRN